MSAVQFNQDADGIVTLTLDMPGRSMNVLSQSSMKDLADIIEKVATDDAIKGLVLTSGKGAFCAGADLSQCVKTCDYEARDDRPDKAGSAMKNGEIDWSDEKVRDGGGRLTLRIFESIKPVIGAINGAAVGVGVTMQLPMDIRIASTKARFGFVFARRGIIPEACSSYFLPRVVGISKALEWCYSGRVFDAQEALDGGLVRSLHEPEDLLPEARRIAREIADNTSSVSVSLTRQMMWRMLGADHPMEAHKIDSRAIYSRGQTEDAKEGVMSFLEKRQPEYPCKPSKDMPSFYPWWEERKYS